MYTQTVGAQVGRYGVIGRVLHVFVKSHILKPLNMTQSTFSIDKAIPGQSGQAKRDLDVLRTTHSSLPEGSAH